MARYFTAPVAGTYHFPILSGGPHLTSECGPACDPFEGLPEGSTTALPADAWVTEPVRPQPVAADDPELCAHVRELMAGTVLRWAWVWYVRRGCPECEREAHEAWVEQVRERLLAGLEAAAEGRNFKWEPDPLTVAATELGHFTLRRADDWDA